MNTEDRELLESVSEGCIAIGNFDGVHRGHHHILAALRELAKQQRTHSVAVTFHPHPIALLRPEFTPPLLTTIPDRCRLLKLAGIDHVVVLPVTAELLSLSPQVFFDEFIIGHLRARGMVEGPNFRFGHDRMGDIRDLALLCHSRAIPLQIVELVADGSSEISSSRIRQAIGSGRIASAVQMLGRPYRIQGNVQPGAGRGGVLGFPTANLQHIATLLPAHGVYAGLTELAERQYVTAISIGPNPTFGDQNTKVECFLDGFQGSLYGLQLDVDLIAEVRELRTFADPAALVSQIRNDVISCRELVTAFASEKCQSRHPSSGNNA